MDRAIGALRRDIALRRVRRQLLRDDLDARAALELSDLALELQAEPRRHSAEWRRLEILRPGGARRPA